MNLLMLIPSVLEKLMRESNRSKAKSSARYKKVTDFKSACVCIIPFRVSL